MSGTRISLTDKPTKISKSDIKRLKKQFTKDIGAVPLGEITEGQPLISQIEAGFLATSQIDETEGIPSVREFEGKTRAPDRVGPAPLGRLGRIIPSINEIEDIITTREPLPPLPSPPSPPLPSPPLPPVTSPPVTSPPVTSPPVTSPPSPPLPSPPLPPVISPPSPPVISPPLPPSVEGTPFIGEVKIDPIPSELDNIDIKHQLDVKQRVDITPPKPRFEVKEISTVPTRAGIDKPNLAMGFIKAGADFIPEINEEDQLTFFDTMNNNMILQPNNEEYNILNNQNKEHRLESGVFEFPFYEEDIWNSASSSTQSTLERSRDADRFTRKPSTSSLKMRDPLPPLIPSRFIPPMSKDEAVEDIRKSKVIHVPSKKLLLMSMPYAANTVPLPTSEMKVVHISADNGISEEDMYNPYIRLTEQLVQYEYQIDRLQPVLNYREEIR